MAPRDRTGIKQIGPGKFLVRVKRKEARTGLSVNRKATVEGTPADAMRVRDDLRKQLSSTIEKRPRTRLKEYAALWLERRVANNEIRASVARKYDYSLRKILPELGELFLDAVTRADVEAYIGRRKQQSGIKGGNTVLNELRLIRTISRDSMAEGYAAHYWADRVKPPPTRKYSKDRPNRLTPSGARRVLASVPKAWKPMVLLMVTTGLRWGELSALHWEDIRVWKEERKNELGEVEVVELAEATIKYGNDRGRIAEVKTTSSYRDVPILAGVLELLGLRRESGLVFPVLRGPGKGGLHRGYPLVNVMKRLCAQLGIQYTTPHGLRRTFNNLARQHATTEVLKSISGHATDEMVEHYSHIEVDEKQAAAQSVIDHITGDGSDDQDEDGDEDPDDDPDPSPAAAAAAEK